MANSVRKYKKFQLKSEYFGKPAFINTSDYGQAKCSIQAKIRILEQDYLKERNPMRKVAIQEVIQSLKFLIK